MKRQIKIAGLDVLLVFCILLSAVLFTSPAFADGRGNNGNNVTLTVDFNEMTHLIFMREEEKLARDVYITLSGLYPESLVFRNIDDAEQQHTTTVRDKLAKYDIDDPNPGTDDEDSIGVFTGEDYGEYFTEKYILLVAWGEESEMDALHVGAFIEELDMLDIVQCPKVIQTTYNLTESDCGLDYTDNKDLQNMLGSLLEGSKNHLRSYVGNIEATNGECTYEAQVLSQEDVDAILGRVCTY